MPPVAILALTFAIWVSARGELKLYYALATVKNSGAGAIPAGAASAGTGALVTIPAPAQLPLLPTFQAGGGMT